MKHKLPILIEWNGKLINPTQKQFDKHMADRIINTFG